MSCTGVHPPMRLLCVPLLVLTFGALASGQGRRGGDPWERMQRFDENGDGKVSRDEFTGPERFFDRMDSDADGFVTKDEAKAMRRGGGGGQRGGERGGMGNMSKRFDTDGDGQVSKQEWDALFKKADENEDGILDNEELMAAMRGRAYNDTAPKVGDVAPKVTAKSTADGRDVDLSNVKRTTVLVFGSWT